MNIRMFRLFLFFIFILLADNIFALQESRSSAFDSKIKLITYNPHTIHKYIGYYDKAAVIIFEADETINEIFMGDPTGWQLIPKGHKLFLKPVGSNAKTNVLIETSKDRMYWMEFDALEASEAGGDDMAYETRFVYSDVITSGGGTSNTRVFSETTIPSFKNTKSLNFKYRVSGSEKITPLVAFDNGQFTFLKFKVVNTDLPAVFSVNNRAEESLINYKIVNDYVVIESVNAVYTLRFGEEVACLFNETLPIYKYDVLKRKTGLFG